jgi:hypothetical protein
MSVDLARSALTVEQFLFTRRRLNNDDLVIGVDDVLGIAS